MELILTRTYFPEGTNGNLTYEGKHICHTIELPWKNNLKQVSCIPEGKYVLRKRYSTQFQWHLECVGVKNRNLILIHPANYALKELQGCIAPVTKLSGAGMGLLSRKACKRLYGLVFKALEEKESVVINITS